MRFRLEASPGELPQKRDALIKALVDEFGRLDPDLAESLEKALPPREPELKFRVLQELRDKTVTEYERLTKRMLTDIGKVLDRSLTGATAGGALAKAFGVGPPPKDPEEEEEEGEPEEPLEPGDYDPKTDEIVPEPEEEEEEEEGEKSLKDEKPPGFIYAGKSSLYVPESIQKATSSQSEPLKYDHTKPVADRDEKGYERIKSILKRKGYTEADSCRGGRLYGLSTNQLLDMLREQ